MAKILSVPVMGSTSASRYEIEFYHGPEGRLALSCTCNAGENGMMCKHLLAVLEGDESVVDTEKRPSAGQDWQRGQTMIQNSSLKELVRDHLAELASIEKEMRALKAKERVAKKDFARAVIGME